MTVNYGIRNDIFITAGESYDRIGAFNPTVPNPGAGGLPGALWFWGEGPGRNGFKRVAPTLWSNWGPRLGLAYSPDEKTVLKASAAYMYFPHFGAMTSGFNTPAIGWILNVTAASLDAGVTPAFNWDDGFPDILPNLPDIDPSFANGQSVVALNRDTMKAGRTLTVNFGVERDLGWGTAFRANYHGKFSHSLPSNDAVRLNQLDPRHLALGTLLFADINSPAAAAAGITSPYEGFTGPVNQALRPFPHMLNINERAAPVTDLTYHGVVLSMQKRYGHGLSFMLNYTISKALGNARWANQGHSLASHIQHTSQRHLRYLYDQDRPQNVAVSWMWELPFGPGKRWGADTSSVVKKLIGGWNIGMQQAYFSAQPLHMSSRVRYPGGFNAIWPDRGRRRIDSDRCRLWRLRPQRSIPEPIPQPQRLCQSCAFYLGEYQDVAFDTSLQLFQRERRHPERYLCQRGHLRSLRGRFLQSVQPPYLGQPEHRHRQQGGLWHHRFCLLSSQDHPTESLDSLLMVAETAEAIRTRRGPANAGPLFFWTPVRTFLTFSRTTGSVAWRAGARACRIRIPRPIPGTWAKQEMVAGFYGWRG